MNRTTKRMTLRMPRWKSAVWTFTLTAWGIWANAFAAQGQGLVLSLDADVFRYEAGKSSVEFYWSIPQNRIAYRRLAEGGFRWTGLFDLTVSTADSVVQRRQWKNENTVPELTGLDMGVDFVDLLRIPLPPGLYKVRLGYQDAQDPGLRAETVLSLKVRDFPADSPMLSDIQLSTKIASKFEERSHPFFKNTLRVVPNPVRLYTPAMPFLYYYCEAYNLGRAAPDTVIRLECRVFDANGKPVTEVEPFQRIVSTRNESSVQWGAVRVGSLPGGKYDLNLKLVRPSGQPADGQSVTFFVYGSAPDSTGTQALSADQMLLNSEFAGMTESEIDGEFNRAIYLFHKDEQREFKNMKSVDAKRAWLFRFWKRLDTNPGTIDNEFRLEYFRRIGLANERYQSFQHEGWQTDRGRVFLMYGEPSSVMLYPNESDMRPYEVWYYDNLQGGVEFVFVDFNMTREYRLVHSTLRGEIRNNDWKDMARKGAY